MGTLRQTKSIEEDDSLEIDPELNSDYEGQKTPK